MTQQMMSLEAIDRVLPRYSGPVVVFMTFITVLASMMISAFVLDELGLPYNVPGGNPLVKIHPMTYLAILTFVMAAIAYGNPIGYIVRGMTRFPGTAYFFAILVIMILWTLLVQHQPLTSLIDTFLPAVLLVFLISDLPPRPHRVLTVFMHVMMNANAMLGLVEVATGWRLTPISLAGETIEWDWRASAFLGHPLENSILTGVYLLMMLYGADRSVTPTVRSGIVALQILGSIAFGGRAAMVLAFALVAVRLGYVLFRVLAGRRFDPRVAGFVCVMVPIVAGIGVLAYNLGIFDRMIERFTNDGGSADTRVSILRIFNSFPLYDLLMGPDPEVLTAKTYIEGTIAGIESFVFGFFLQSGVIISIIFFCGLGAISYDLWRVGSRAGLLHLAYFYIVAAGAASLSVKGQTMVQFVILFMTIEAMPSLLDRDQA